MTQPAPPVVPNLYPQPLPNYTNGVAGATGNGIESITQPYGDGTALITYTNGDTEIINLPQGDAGTNGSTIYSGASSPPPDATGVTGDYYLITTTSILRGPKLSNGTWTGSASTSIKGATGATGASGPTNPLFDVVQYGKLSENFNDADFIAARNWSSGLLCIDNSTTTYSALPSSSIVTGFTGPGVMRMSVVSSGGAGAKYSSLFWAADTSQVSSFDISAGPILMGMLIRKGSTTTNNGIINFGVKTAIAFPPTSTDSNLFISQVSGSFTSIYENGIDRGTSTDQLPFNVNTAAVYVSLVIDHAAKFIYVYKGTGTLLMSYDYKNDEFASVTGHIVPFLTVGTQNNTTSIFDIDYMFCVQKFTTPYINPEL
jgi:hypothetical protein